MLKLKKFLKSAVCSMAVCAILLLAYCAGNPNTSAKDDDDKGVVVLPDDTTGLVLDDDDTTCFVFNDDDTTGLDVGLEHAWLTCTTQKKESCKGYIFLAREFLNNWLDVFYDNKRDCWDFAGIASAGWFANKDSLKIGWSGMEGDGVVGWSFLFSGTYKVSCNTLTLSESGKEPVIYIRRSIPRQCNLLPK